jgi:hypothetical protein
LVLLFVLNGCEGCVLEAVHLYRVEMRRESGDRLTYLVLAKPK